jgi:hypothetical protein
MKLLLALTTVTIALAGVKMKNLPEPVRKTVLEQTKGAQIKNIGKEVEKGATMYEVETVVNGRTRDLMIDSAGAVVSVEEEVAIASIPAAAKAGIEKLADGATITKVEAVTKGQSRLWSKARPSLK